MTGSMVNTLTLRVAGDFWNGSPQFVVTVDGQQIGGVQTTTASHAQGQWQDITLTGDFPADPSKVAVSFTNDAYGGSAATDRNLYVQSLTLNGATYAGSALPATLGPAASDSAVMLSNGTITFNIPVQNTLTLRVAADSWNGSPQFVVTVDGQQIGGVQTATASHAQGQWQDITLTGNFAADPSKVAVSFTNDAYGGSAATDRNLYVQSLTLNGATYAGSALPPTLGPAASDSAVMLSNGTITFNTASATAAAAPAPVAAPVIAAFGSPFTDSAEPTVSGTAAAGSQVSIYLDGSTSALATVAATAAGAWSYTPATALADGLHSFTAVAKNAAGTASAASAAQSLTVDTQPPSERVTALSVAGNDVVDATEGGASGVAVAGTLSANLAAGDSLVVNVGGVSTVVPAADINGTSFAFTAPKPASGWAAGTATAQVQDAAGNAGPALSQAFTTQAAAPTGHLAMLGVSLSGAEYSANKLPGIPGTDYTYPNDAEIDYYAQKGFNVIRLPFLWERMQPTEDGPLSASQLSQMDAVVNYANAKGMKVILDPHNYGSGYGNLIGSAGTPTSAFADFWGKLAAHYASNSGVMFGLMNEPQVPSATDWLGDANAAIAAIRAAGATSQEVLVPGAYWDGGASWTTTDNASVIGTGIKDPSNNFVFEVHQYLDSDASGTHADVVSPTIGSSRLAAITQWAKATGSKLFLGEFGVAQDPTSLSAMDDMLSYISKNSDVWQGATDWAAGPWLGNNMYSVEPTGLGTASVTDKPQMAVLQKYAPK